MDGGQASSISRSEVCGEAQMCLETFTVWATGTGAAGVNASRSRVVSIWLATADDPTMVAAFGMAVAYTASADRRHRRGAPPSKPGERSAQRGRHAGRDVSTVGGVITEDEVRHALSQVLAPRRTADRTTSMGAGSDDLEPGRRYLAGTVEGGWAVPSWPVVHGGRGAEPDEVSVIKRVLREFAVPDLYPYVVGLSLCGPALLAHGSQEQHRMWLRSIASGAEIWCQMFSEPEAGSDLANLGLRAVRDGDEWVLDGQKVWTSRAVWAKWGLCLARTDPEVPKHAGLSMFAVDMHAPGVEVRPLVQMNGDDHFSEVFVSGARVPDAWRIGDIGAGWKVAMTVLAHERASAGAGGGGGNRRSRGVRIPGWLGELAGRGALSDAVARQRAMRLHARDAAVGWQAERASASRQPGPAGSGSKLHATASFQGRTRIVKDSYGATGMLTDHDGHVEFMTGPSMSIRGGTDEIQRNIVGERILGLPGEPRVDRDISWSKARKGELR
jgi:alkylation response protein AidB-like acyl-CoA dehydrogenase